MVSHRLCLIHPTDPRSEPVGTVETRLNGVLSALPTDFSVLFVGADHVGDLRLGAGTAISVAGRSVDFLPVRRGGSGSFAAGLMRHLSAVRTAARAEVASVSVHDFTWVPLARLVGRPIVLVVHADPHAGAVAGRVPLPTALRESLALRVADRVVACDAGFARRCRDANPVIAAKTELLALPASDEAATVSLFDGDAQVARLWERHRRLFDAHAVRRGLHAAA
jgi:hypothetical protein